MVQQPIHVAQASQTISTISSPPCTTCGTVVPYVLSGTATSNLAVTFGIDTNSSTPGSCNITGNTVTINGGTGFPGTCVIEWFQIGDQNYAAAPIRTQTITVT
jgi:hypothetical protein